MPTLLRLDLTAGRAAAESLPPGRLGGVALAAELLSSDSDDLIIAFSPLVGTPLTSSAKFVVAAKSPLTGRFNDSLASGRFALRGKGTGHDAFVLTGTCERPSILRIDEAGARIEPAGELWGREVSPAAAALAAAFGPDWAWGVIGPAGENRVRFASVSFAGRHAGRGGLGAVLGAKNLKAIGVRGAARRPLADPAGVVAWARELNRRSFGPAVAKFRELGSFAELLERNRTLKLPAVDADASGVPAGCVACAIGCDRIAGKRGGKRLEAESFAALGPRLGVGDPEFTRQLAHRCDELGLDTVSTGVVLGLIPGATLETLGAICQRSGIGDILADGVRAAAARLGVPPELAPHVGGLEAPSHDLGASLTLALGFAVNARGGDHNRAGAADLAHSLAESPEAMAQAAIDAEDRAALLDSLILCNFLRGAFDDLWGDAASMLTAVVGGAWTPGEVRRVARRAVNARRRFNLAVGVDDTPSPWFWANAGGVTPDALAELIGHYRRLRGWSPDGVPVAPESP